jgi:endonuclease III
MRIKGEYATRIKRLYRKLRRESPDEKPEPQQRDPVEVMLLGILQQGTTDKTARTSLAHLLDHVVDHNDLRVTPVRELVDYLQGRVPQVKQKAESIHDSLNGVFDKLNHLNLHPLAEMSKKDARDFLESVAGLNPCAVAGVLLQLGHSAFPVPDHVLAVLKAENALPDEVDVATAQTWLERHIPAGDAAEFCQLMLEHASTQAPGWTSQPPAPPTPAKRKPAARPKAKPRKAKAASAKTKKAKPAAKKEKRRPKTSRPSATAKTKTRTRSKAARSARK